MKYCYFLIFTICYSFVTYCETEVPKSLKEFKLSCSLLQGSSEHITIDPRIGFSMSFPFKYNFFLFVSDIDISFEDNLKENYQHSYLRKVNDTFDDYYRNYIYSDHAGAYAGISIIPTLYLKKFILGAGACYYLGFRRYKVVHWKTNIFTNDTLDYREKKPGGDFFFDVGTYPRKSAFSIKSLNF